MSEMNETARAVLRQEVLNIRVKFREARTRCRQLAAQAEAIHQEALKLANAIMDLQKAAGDAIEIDPTMGHDESV